jgi:hypothetical protein
MQPSCATLCHPSDSEFNLAVLGVNRQCDHLCQLTHGPLAFARCIFLDELIPQSMPTKEVEHAVALDFARLLRSSVSSVSVNGAP